MSGAPQWSLAVTTPLGGDALTLRGLEGEEHISDLFLLNLTMTAQDPVDASAILGKATYVTLIDGDGNKRYLHGLVTRFAQSGNECTAELRPWLWMLSLIADNRIFQSKSVPDILTAVFGDSGFTDYRNDLRGNYDTLDYCVQFQETNFAFVSRLMEEYGIFYFFEHSDSAHTLVLADDPASFNDCANAASIPFLPLPSGGDWLTDLRIETLSSEARVGVQAYQADDFNFITPSTELKVTTGNGTRRVYEYPGRYEKLDAGEAVAKRRIEAYEAVAKQISGASPVRALCAGGAFTLTGHPDPAVNARYALRSVAHSAQRREYSNRFTAFPASVPFRPPRITPAPRIGGSQTAMVVGPSGKEIYTDKYGRVKVQFHWDQLGEKNQDSSCWIRVAQNWAGVSWGAFTLPRIGQEVVVTFLDGDPDRPLITGCVYNGDNPAPYTLPDEQTRTVLKSNSSEGGGGFNELRFEDKKNSEEIYVHAQKDMNVDVLNDQTVTITQNRAVTISKGNDTLTISEGDRTVTVSKGKETHSVQDTRALTVTGAETHSNKADFTQTVSGNFTLTVDGDITIKASGAVTLQSGTSMTIKAGTSLAISSGTSLSGQAGTSLSLQGATTAELKASASGTVDGGGMLALKGGIVKLN
ncbi:MAG TPA: type VI secretion system tip protein TssI/VgrG [Candidatus Binataceae bacterium]|nr:type VI secretion system tip protein TssI/VgrG [Candidatus Binataceae bacterium]